MIKDRYYVQHLTDQIFLIRERQSIDEEPGPDDHIVRSFAFRQDAYSYAESMNDMQRKLDAHYGHWIQQAAEKSKTES